MTVNEFKIYTVWKGEFNETTYLTTYYFGSSCSGWATLGEEYIVYGGFSACSRTRRLSNAQEDLAELGAGQSPIPGTSAPVPESVQAIKNAPKPGQEQSSTREVIPGTSLVAEEGQTPTPTLDPATPTPTPEPATPTPTPEPATPTPTPEPATPTSTPEPATPTPTPEPATPTPTPEPATPTSTPGPATPTSTPEPATPTPKSEPAMPTPTPEPARATPAPEAIEKQAPPPWSLAVLGVFLVAALVGAMALVRVQRSRRDVS